MSGGRPGKRARASSAGIETAKSRRDISREGGSFPIAAIAELLSDSSLCDGEVVTTSACGQHRCAFPVSRMLLAASSSFFKAAFTFSMREGEARRVVLTEDITEDSVSALLDYAHTGQMSVSTQTDELLQLPGAANFLGFDDELMGKVWAKILESITLQNCIVFFCDHAADFDGGAAAAARVSPNTLSRWRPRRHSLSSPPRT